MYYKLWKSLYNHLKENDPENEIISLMEELENKENFEDILKDLINSLK